MVRPPETEVHSLKAIAREMSEIGDESGYLVGVATDQHRSFRRTRRPASALERELFLDAARRAASREGFAIEEVSGGVDLIASGGGHLRKYRVKRGTRTADGAYRFVCGLGSSLLTTEVDALFVEERWLLGYISSEDHTLDEIIAAEVVGSEGNGPVTLLLGAVIPLIDMTPPPNFTSTEEGLDGFDDEEGTEDGSAGVA
ncbi:hypothetical protein [Blastococcus sp. TF02A-35]|uniref:hypothetical protein n=1 Tax=Blastococcus sp. TF02A-35 TaxID=2559612 RepID=UPI0010732754|nr:hypothetical protein [Blastococcus sp. TF02A_35]TFV52496.1 hypothetical protein E4P43_05755 [Blastococcus sp. TF02A_35]